MVELVVEESGWNVNERRDMWATNKSEYDVREQQEAQGNGESGSLESPRNAIAEKSPSSIKQRDSLCPRTIKTSGEEFASAKTVPPLRLKKISKSRDEPSWAARTISTAESDTEKDSGDDCALVTRDEVTSFDEMACEKSRDSSSVKSIEIVIPSMPELGIKETRTDRISLPRETMPSKSFIINYILGKDTEAQEFDKIMAHTKATPKSTDKVVTEALDLKKKVQLHQNGYSTMSSDFDVFKSMPVLSHSDSIKTPTKGSQADAFSCNPRELLAQNPEQLHTYSSFLTNQLNVPPTSTNTLLAAVLRPLTYPPHSRETLEPWAPSNSPREALIPNSIPGAWSDHQHPLNNPSGTIADIDAVRQRHYHHHHHRHHHQHHEQQQQHNNSNNKDIIIRCNNERKHKCIGIIKSPWIWRLRVARRMRNRRNANSNRKRRIKERGNEHTLTHTLRHHNTPYAALHQEIERFTRFTYLYM
ncbi:PREDICTED: uncharacterized protein LOC105366622 [Ceratosolen solmsi marchali]|uniref:Uncharacterized protein LOC105366622 n=1 Tax=Ceratosolen solmsi marchali TaxID=326594 RepID=A0AAJ6YSK2_9HYME|nr:PREDICTED: uncharacterized protein LOC105366622 [Ceratosolen solmsi marchali]